MARASILHRRASFAGVALSLLLASAVLTALGVLVESGLGGGVEPARFASADVVIGAAQSIPVPEDVAVPLAERVRLPADAVSQAAAVPGVELAVGDVTIPLTTRDARAFDGHGWASSALAPWTLIDGEAPASATEVVVTAALGTGVGSTVPLAVGDVFAEYTVSGIAALSGVPHGASPRGQANVVFFSDDRAAALASHTGEVDAIGVIAAPDVSIQNLASSLRAALPGMTVVTGVRRGDVESLDGAAARSNLTAFSTSFAGFTTLIVAFVVASTVALAVSQRRREFAVVRAVGAAPSQIVGMVVREVSLVAGFAVLLGIAPGYLLAGLAAEQLERTGVIAGGFSLVNGPLAGIGAVALCMIAAVSAALVAARKPARTEPIEALRESLVEQSALGRGRAVAGAILIAAGLGASALPAVMTGLAGLAAVGGAVIMMFVGVGLIGPALVVAALRVAGPLLRRTRSASSVLADASMRHFSRRVASAVVPLALAVGFSAVQLFVAATTATAAAHQSSDGMIADVLVAAPTGGLADARVAQIDAIPGVASANPVVRSSVIIPMSMAGDVSWEVAAAVGIGPAATAETLDLGVSSGSLEALRGADTVAISADAAHMGGVALGDPYTFRLGDGAAITATIVAVYDRGLGFGDIAMNGEVLRGHTTSGLVDYVLVAADAGAAEGVSTALSAEGFVALDRDDIAAAGERDRALQSQANVLAVAVILGYVALSVVNSLVMATASRRNEFATLRLFGASDRQIRCVTGIESVVISALAVAVAVCVSVPPLVGAALGVSRQPVPTVLPAAAVIIVAVALVVAIGSVRVATRAALRLSVSR